LKSDTLDYRGVTFHIRGDLVISKSACLKNAKGYVRGNILIKDDAQVDFCSLIALGNVTISDNACVRGNIACCESLTVENNARVFYPSLIYLSSNSPIAGVDNRVITIQDNAIVRGTIATAQFGNDTYHVRVMVQGRSRVEGLIICPGAVTLYGNITGSIYAGRIVYSQGRNIYENWLREVSITGCDLSGMTVPLLFPAERNPRYLQVSSTSRKLL
jgi:cytoskeletal protein CcmA (bactofilin family)